MITIFKYPLQVLGQQLLEVPEDSQFITCQMQGGVPCIWAKVNTERPPRAVSIHVYGTGHPIQFPHLVYIGTVQMQGGDLVFHVFYDAAYRG